MPTSTRSSASSKSSSESDSAAWNDLEKEFNITDEDLEQAFEDFINQPEAREAAPKDSAGVKVASVLAGGVALVMLVMVLQLAGLEVGPDISFTQHLAFPLIMLLSGLLIWSRRRSKKQARENKEEEIPDLKIRHSGTKGTNESASGAAYTYTSGESASKTEGHYDAYAFKKKKRLFRSRRDSKLMGVCGGIAHYFGLDPTVVRIIFALSTAFYGSTVLVYLVLGFVLPKAPKNKT